MFLEFISWWYGKGWINAWRMAKALPSRVERDFSIGVLLRTLFSPWRRIISYGGSSLDSKLKAMLDNVISRMVGLVVRSIALLISLILTLIAGLLGLILALIWPLLPLSILYLIYRGIVR